jgi:surface protein
MNEDSSNMFGKLTSIASLNLTDYDTSKVTNMSLMFWNCSSLESIDLSHFDTSSVTLMSAMFN